ncbi:MAG: alanine racemase [Elusimicrobia bacterium RIFOXYA2_FULL_39_19]|nr:MAG: alanine racemase [Elusimicrobia bacterium RIFOXYA2_FULL_39_19]
MKISRPNWVEINTSNITHNILQIKKHIHPKTKIISVIKTNAYGHGLVETAKILSKEPSVWGFGVTNVEEGVALRNNNIKLPVLILGAMYPFDYFKEVIKYNIIPTITSIDAIKALSEHAVKEKKVSKFHLKVDTGMGRIGLLPKGVDDFLTSLNKFKNIKMEGVFTHFSSAGTDKQYTLSQIRKFDEIIKDVKKKYSSDLLFHASNSSGILKYKSANYDLVRCGLCTYGLSPFKNSDKYINLLPVLSWKTKIVYLKKVKKGKSISYNRTFVTKRPSVIATIPLGYGDGYSRALSNKGSVIIKNRKANIIGTVTMEMSMIDVTDIPGVKLGDEVIIIGSDSFGKKITTDEIAYKCGTINYEIVTNINPRVPRIYV